jgi:hypothetical protein
MHRMAAILAVLLVSAPALADKYDAAIAEGNKLLDKGKARDAMAAFQKAVDARPGDARALSELSAAAVAASDWDTAADAAQKSIDGPGAPPKVVAASYYNLGRAHEARAKFAEARAAYAASLKLRPDEVVRHHLLATGGDATAGAPLDPLGKRELVGPFAALDDVCKRPGYTECSTDADPEPDTTGKLGAPFQDLGRVKHFPEGAEWFSFDLALKVGGAWWILPHLAEVGNRNEVSYASVEMVGKLAVIHYEHMAGRFDWDIQNGIIVCAATGKAPVCIGPIPTYGGYNQHTGGKENGTDHFYTYYDCEAAVTADAVEVRPATKPTPGPSDTPSDPAPKGSCERLPSFGKHAISF